MDKVTHDAWMMAKEQEERDEYQKLLLRVAQLEITQKLMQTQIEMLTARLDQVLQTGVSKPF